MATCVAIPSMNKRQKTTQSPLKPACIASGAHGDLYYWKDPGTGRECVIKHPKESLVYTMHEISIMLSLPRHPSIVPLLSCENPLHTRKVPAIIMPKFDMNMERFVHNRYPGGMPDAVLCKMMRQLLSALSVIHASQIIHGDIKPANILINVADQIPAICDFGLSMQLDHLLIYPECNIVSYCMRPPELLHQEAAHITTRADIWSMGLTMLFMAMGRYVVSDNSLRDVKGDPLMTKASMRAVAWSIQKLMDGFDPKDAEDLELPAAFQVHRRYPTFDSSGRTWVTCLSGVLSPGAREVIFHALRVNPLDRLSADELLELPWFKM